MSGYAANFFTDDTYFTGPALTHELVKAAESRLKYRLPPSYLALLAVRNGGVPRARCFHTTTPTSWAPDHVEIAAIRGVGGEWGIDSESGVGSIDMISEWGYPDLGIIICEMPSGGHDAIMLDYSQCGPLGEPSVVYIDDDRSVVRLAANFAQFQDGLYECPSV